MTSKTKKSGLANKLMAAGLVCAGIAGCLMLSGCQVSVAGQTLPSAYYMQDDLQYYPKGPKHKLSQEAAALQAARAEAQLNR